VPAEKASPWPIAYKLAPRSLGLLLPAVTPWAHVLELVLKVGNALLGEPGPGFQFEAFAHDL
jgi:hypothetical protein